MKNFTKQIGIKAMTLLFVMVSLMSFAQTQTTKDLKSIAVLNINTKESDLKPGQIGTLSRIELGKLGLYNVMDDYEVYSILAQKKFNANDCYSKGN
jgi:hypothetical protein